ncbi:ATP-binding protein [Paenibacillus chartarius]|uniref:histidine kinase n=1 Tax=Paenibacillus chartarius TaxID=747481 RepID=A0ABV6DEE6_9BACL
MMRSLYVRVALTFLLTVMLSLVLPFLVGSRINRDALLDRVHDDMVDFANSTIYIVGKLQPPDMNEALQKMATVKHYGLWLYGSGGDAQVFNAADGMAEIDDAAVKQVLGGAVYDSLQEGREVTLNELIVGFPQEVNGSRYALFVVAHPRRDMGNNAQRDLIKVLLTVLVPGGLLILLAARYIVKPLQKLTEATKRISRGDFRVRVDIDRKDEIGLLAKTFNHMAGELQQMETMRQDFVSNVSHEIQTPLTSIHGFAIELQQPGMPEEERLKYLRIMERESARLSRLGRNLLKLASLESDQYPLHPRELELDEQLRRVVVACEPLWAGKDLLMDLDELERTKIVADEDALGQVWINLLHNSIKFTPAGGDIRVELDSTKPGWVEVRISDSGIGIAPQDRERVFERFFKADRSRSSGKGPADGTGYAAVGSAEDEWTAGGAAQLSGSGLGLAITKRIVELHGGQIRLDSELGSGTTVTVTLPVIRPQA